jgi:hypothetical protein
MAEKRFTGTLVRRQPARPSERFSPSVTARTTRRRAVDPARGEPAIESTVPVLGSTSTNRAGDSVMNHAVPR